MSDGDFSTVRLPPQISTPSLGIPGSMVPTKHTQQRNVDQVEDESTSSRIIQAATKVFAAKGYDGASTKEICELAQVNIAAIHYHFGSKAELFQHILKSFGGSRLQSVQAILKNPKNRDELQVRLHLFVEQWIDVYIGQPDVWRMIQHEAELLHARSEIVFQQVFTKVFETLVEFLKEAKRAGLLEKQRDPKIAARFLFNQVAQQTRSDGVIKKYYGMSLREEAFRKLWVEETVAIFLAGVCGGNNS